MPDIDLFNFFRWGLSIIATIYCVVVTAQSTWSCYVWLSTNDRYIGVLTSCRNLSLHGV